METTIVYWGYIGVILGIMENKMETTIVYWGYIGVILGIMENKMETTIVYWGYIGVILSSEPKTTRQTGMGATLSAHRMTCLQAPCSEGCS